MRTFDPLYGVVYVHMSRDTDPYFSPLESGHRLTRLPVGYANGSRRTCLNRRPSTDGIGLCREKSSDSVLASSL